LSLLSSQPIAPGEELLVWYNGEDNPEIAAAIEEERASARSKRSSPKSRKGRTRRPAPVHRARPGADTRPGAESWPPSSGSRAGRGARRVSVTFSGLGPPGPRSPPGPLLNHGGLRALGQFVNLGWAPAPREVRARPLGPCTRTPQSGRAELDGGLRLPAALTAGAGRPHAGRGARGAAGRRGGGRGPRDAQECGSPAASVRAVG
jgi:hypothetical protein